MHDIMIVMGAPGSPYTRKLLAALRFRRIPYRFVTDAGSLEDLPRPRIALLPTCYFPGERTPVTDTTPILHRLDRENANRRLAPSDPALALIEALIEDYADEWLTKAMFHYRWSFPADVSKSATVLPNWFGGPLGEEALRAAGEAFADRQIGRLGYVGSNPSTAPVIEDSFRRLLSILESHFAEHRFLLGERPTAADLGIYGQLTQLALFDPTPMAAVTRDAPRVLAWTMSMEDLSGSEGTALFGIDSLPGTLRALVAEIGRTYAPLLLANAAAITKGDKVVVATIDGVRWEQAVFSYQAKCLSALRMRYERLDQHARAAVQAALAGTGCGAIFAA